MQCPQQAQSRLNNIDLFYGGITIARTGLNHSVIVMSLYRRKQMLMKVKEWSGSLQCSFPSVIAMRLGGCDAVPSGDNGNMMIVGSAVVSVVAHIVYKKVSLKLKKFIAKVEADPELFEQYKKDCEIGIHEDMIRNLQSEMTGAYILAADQAKRGHGYASGFCYSRVKLAEAKLRRLGY